MNKMNFSARTNNSLLDDNARVITESLITLTKMGIEKHYPKDTLATKFSTIGENYGELNSTTKEKLFKYCIAKSGLESESLDIYNKGHMEQLFSNPTAANMFFAIVTQALNTVNAATEVQDIMPMANVVGVGVGDSWTGEIESKKLYNVEDTSYGNNVTRSDRQFRSPITLTPSPKEATVDFDIYQMAALGYDFGKEIAKIAMSFRAQMYQDVVDEIFTVANVSATPFYESMFAKTSYQELANRVGGANSVRPVAYGTNIAFGKMSDTVSGGFTIQDENVKKGYITDMYGVPSSLLEQKVNTSDATYAFRVPDDKVLLVSSIGDKPVKVIVEEWTRVIAKDGTAGSLHTRVYKLFQSWVVDLATQGAYGIQEV